MGVQVAVSLAFAAVLFFVGFRAVTKVRHPTAPGQVTP
jgi:hypothetical protein